MMQPNIRLHAGFLYFLDTHCNIGPGLEAADYIIHWFFKDCMKKTGLFSATVPEETIDQMLLYAGFSKEQQFNQYWLGIETCYPDKARSGFPKFWG